MNNQFYKLKEYVNECKESISKKEKEIKEITLAISRGKNWKNINIFKKLPLKKGGVYCVRRKGWPNDISVVSWDRELFGWFTLYGSFSRMPSSILSSDIYNVEVWL